MSIEHQGLLKPAEAANWLKSTVGTLAKWRHQGVGPRFVKMGSSVRYDPVDLRAHVEGQKFCSTSETEVAA
jgi:hypothetical protein